MSETRFFTKLKPLKWPVVPNTLFVLDAVYYGESELHSVIVSCEVIHCPAITTG